MKNIVKIIAAVIIAAIVFAGVYFLYGALKEEFKPNSLITEPINTNTSEPASDTSESSDEPEESNVTDETDETDESLYPSPDFTVTDVDGESIKLSDTVGKPVVLNFWASWCYYCKVEMPDFETMYRIYGDRVQFMMVDMTDGSRETVDEAKLHIAIEGFTFPIYFDTEGEAANAYRVTGIPATYFIDGSGNTVARANGAIDADTLEQGIEMLLGQE